MVHLDFADNINFCKSPVHLGNLKPTFSFGVMRVSWRACVMTALKIRCLLLGCLLLVSLPTLSPQIQKAKWIRSEADNWQVFQTRWRAGRALASWSQQPDVPRSTAFPTRFFFLEYAKKQVPTKTAWAAWKKRKAGDRTVIIRLPSRGLLSHCRRDCKVQFLYRCFLKRNPAYGKEAKPKSWH